MIDVRDLSSGKCKHLVNILKHISYRIMFGSNKVELIQIIQDNNLDDLVSEDDIVSMLDTGKVEIVVYQQYYRYYNGYHPINTPYTVNLDISTTKFHYHSKTIDGLASVDVPNTDKIWNIILNGRIKNRIHYGFNKANSDDGYETKEPKPERYKFHPKDKKTWTYSHCSWRVESLLINRRKDKQYTRKMADWYLKELGYTCNVKV